VLLLQRLAEPGDVAVPKIPKQPAKKRRAHAVAFDHLRRQEATSAWATVSLRHARTSSSTNGLQVGEASAIASARRQLPGDERPGRRSPA
jgi:hypothetical protein